ncbi:MAG TPA: twin-arginine translocase subunit TatC [Syntrophaceae bacterium]|nr:twin-arginine translocase subunit TatC [Syntrophaceae bacterium]
MEAKGTTQYIEEIRHRVIRFLLIALVISIVAYIFSDVIIKYLQKPYSGTLAFYKLPEAFFVKIGIGISTGLFFAMPYLFARLSYILTSRFLTHPKRYALLLSVSACMLYFLGAFLSYAILLPQGIKFLIKLGGQSIEPMISIQKYMSFCTVMIFGMGLFFQMPLILLFLGRVGMINYRMLSSFRKYAILLIAIGAAIFTPTSDIVNMLLMAGPLWLLYELSTLLVRIFPKKT